MKLSNRGLLEYLEDGNIFEYDPQTFNIDSVDWLGIFYPLSSVKYPKVNSYKILNKLEKYLEKNV